MRKRDIIARAGRNLRQAKARTILTSMAIAVGAFTIALAAAAGNGGRLYLESIINSAGDKQSIQVMAKQDRSAQMDPGEPVKLNDQAENQNTEPGVITERDIAKLKTIDGVVQVKPVVFLTPHSITANNSEPYRGTIDVQYDKRLIELSAGKLSDNGEIKDGEVILPHKFLKAFGFSSAEAALGQKVTVEFAKPVNASAETELFSETFTIVAVDKMPASPLVGYRGAFYLSNADGLKIAAKQKPAGSPEEYSTLAVIAKEGADVNKIKDDVINAGKYEVFTFEDVRAGMNQAVMIVQSGLIAFGMLALFASIFGIVNTQYISVLERTQQVGLMKALGMRKKDIARLFRYEAAWIGFLGGMIGVFLAYLITLFNPVINDALKMQSGTELLKMDWIAAAILVVGLMLVAIISGFFPSRKAAKLNPIEALRTE